MKRILVIEDDPAMSQYLGDILTKAGFQVSFAMNGIEGMEAIRAIAPDLLVLDIFMPEKDGLEVLMELRRVAPELRVLVTSGKQHLLSGSSLHLAEKLGANATLPKPFTPKELLSQVSKLTGVVIDPPGKPALASSASK
jgi:DNA-binding response OmpR family regulator